MTVEHPPLTEIEREALHRSRDILANALMRGNRAVLIAQLVRLANHRAKERSAQEWQMLFEDYADDLCEFSDSHTTEAIKEFRKHSNFFPTIAEISQRCLELVARDKHRLERCEMLLREKP